MKERLKICTAWFMLGMLFYSICGYLLAFKLSETFNRNSIQEYLSGAADTDLQIFKITDLSSVTRKNKHEIIVNGSRYDVKKELTKEGVTYFYCIRDTVEDNLFLALHNSIHHAVDTPGQKHNTHAIDFFKHLAKDYFHDDTLSYNLVSGLMQEPLPHNKNGLSCPYFNILTPPPKISLS